LRCPVPGGSGKAARQRNQRLRSSAGSGAGPRQIAKVSIRRWYCCWIQACPAHRSPGVGVDTTPTAARKAVAEIDRRCNPMPLGGISELQQLKWQRPPGQGTASAFEAQQQIAAGP